MIDNIMAFPVSGESEPWQLGMNLRDYFAGHALAGILASDSGSRVTPGRCAFLAYERHSSVSTTYRHYARYSPEYLRVAATALEIGK